jgi:DNA polymerase I-like protein with 3'-5' exonuclease and polymerase domains
VTLTLDFETKPITPADPWPEPVGVAIQNGGRPGRYLAWGHPSGNNTTLELARRELKDQLAGASRVVMFNAPFDVGVARRLDVGMPWAKAEDAQVLAFLADPYAKKRDLKTFAHVELGLAPDARDELHAWIKTYVKEAKGRKRLGEFYHLAPGHLVGKYARHDTRATHGLFRHWRKRFGGEAYAREMALLPVLDDMTRCGFPLDAAGLSNDAPAWAAQLERTDRYLRRLLRGGVDLGKHEKVADAMEKAGLVTEWIETATGRRSLSYDNLKILAGEGKASAAFVEAWGYRSVLVHTLRTFVEPWLAAGDTLHPQWNSVKKDFEGGGFGAVTGRLSSSPNVQNIINEIPAFRVPASWLPLPRMRRYVVAPAGGLIVGVDVSQQEPRILADVVGDPLRQWYIDEPRMDVHQKVSDEIRRVTGRELTRKAVKIVNLAAIYKNGIASTAAKIGCSYDEAAEIRRTHGRVLPGIKQWERRLASSPTFGTAGGRVYHHDPERPYKSGNTYVQGSAADQLKRIMIEAAPRLAHFGARLGLSVHDELVAFAPRNNAVDVRAVLERVIEETGTAGGERRMFSVPMLGDSYVRERWQK